MRATGAVILGALLVYACSSMYDFLQFTPSDDPWYRIFTEPLMELRGLGLPLTGRLLAASLCFLVGAFGIFWLANHHRCTDFLIETEGEMKKVAWPSRDEVLGATTVVLASVVIVTAWLWAVDLFYVFLGRQAGRLF